MPRRPRSRSSNPWPGRGCDRTVLPVVSRQVFWRKVLAWSGLVVAAAVVLAVIVWVMFWPLSDLIANHDVSSITDPHRGAALQTARDAARGRLVALGAGLFAAGALVYTARNFSLARQGQVTDRHTKAIEQLGSTNLDVRLGGIYALERIARDSARDLPTITNVLSAFIRQHSEQPVPLQAPPPTPPISTIDDHKQPDVQAAAAVIGSWDPPRELMPINLSFANFISARLIGARFPGSYLIVTNLSYAELNGADLHDANLNSANLTSADLRGADLRDADLTDAKLTDALWTEDVVAPAGWQRDANSGRLKPARH
jgi:hypothetical protein